MKTNKEQIITKDRKLPVKYFTGLYPPGGYVAWPTSKSMHTVDDIPYRRTKTGGYVALPATKH